MDELTQLYSGVRVFDAVTNSRFLMRVKLAYVQADYPGRLERLMCFVAHCKVNAMCGAQALHGCVKCWISGRKTCNRVVFQGGPCLLPPEHKDHRPFPSSRTHDEIRNLGRVASTLVRADHAGFVRNTGITGFSFLFFLPYKLDIVLDTVLDFMHCEKGVVKHLAQCMKGTHPLKPSKRKLSPQEIKDREQVQEKQEQCSLTSLQQETVRGTC